MAKQKRNAAPARQTRAVASLSIDGIPFPLPRVTGAARSRAERLLGALTKTYPDAHCELNYSKPHELLIATILSAQSTDVGVNKATPALFAKFPTPADYARATPAQIEPYVRSLGFFRNKSKAVHLAMKAVVEQFGGDVPRTMTDLLSLHGVARKTANVVLGNAFGVNDGVVVDTHVERLSVRMGLVSRGTNVQMIERSLMALFPRERWCDISHLLIFHGRRACKARGARCADHPICTEFGIGCENRAVTSTAKKRPTSPT
jgi:endonuclease-3